MSNEILRPVVKDSEWKKMNSRQWDFDDEFSITLYKWGKRMWDVELWKGEIRISITEAFTNIRAKQIAKKYREELNTREKLLLKWKELGGN